MADDLRALIGGYATSTLSREERERLFTKALDDDDVFATLVDEEPLRAVLVDPPLRQALLQALSKPDSSWGRWFDWASLRGWTALSSAAALIVICAAVVYRLMPTGPGPATSEMSPAAGLDQTRAVARGTAGLASLSDWVTSVRDVVEDSQRLRIERPSASEATSSVAVPDIVLIPDRTGRAALFEITDDRHAIKVFPDGDDWADVRRNAPIAIPPPRSSGLQSVRTFRLVIADAAIDVRDRKALDAAVTAGQVVVFAVQLESSR